MKKIVLAGLVAISMIALSQQQASAWVNSRFGVGLNWNFQSGGNNILWGAWRNGQPPGPEAFGGGYGHQHYHGAMQPSYAPMPQAGYAPMQSAPNPAQYASPSSAQYGSPYQFANYPRPIYYYPAPSYYYYAAPSYYYYYDR